MTDEETEDLAPEDPGEKGGSSLRKGRQAFRKVTRELSDEDLANPSVQRLLLDDLDRLEIENEELKRIRGDFHSADKKVAVLEEKAKSAIGFEILSGACLTVGAALIGYAPSLWDSQPSGVIALLLGAVLIVGGITAKAIKR